MPIGHKRSRRTSGFSLAELVAALTIGSMAMVVVLVIYATARKSTAALTQRLEGDRLAVEVLQRIAEDIDRTLASGSDATVTLESKFSNGFNVTRLQITETFNDEKNEQQELRKITWQSNFDDFTQTLSIYRARSGITMEDPLLDDQKELWEHGLFVPVCTDVTYFSIEIPQGEEMLNKWNTANLPKGITTSISFAEPYKEVDGTWQAFEEDLFTRTIAIDRTRKIKFNIAVPPDVNDINSPGDNINDIPDIPLDGDVAPAVENDEDIPQ